MKLYPHVLPPHPNNVNPVRFVVNAFVNTFGITRPSPQTEAKAGRWIILMLAALLAVVALAAWLLLAAMTHR
jgi:hypothetical protein